MDPLLGSITLFAGNFAPRGWAFCDGTLLSLSQNTALYSVIGTAFGGDGISNFALPDLRGRVPIQQGTGPGLTTRNFGNKGGEENVTLMQTQMPAHTHAVVASSAPGDAPSPAGNILAVATDADSGGNPKNFVAPDSGNINLAPQTIASVGGSQPHDNMPPFLAINYIIATVGIFPSRN